MQADDSTTPHEGPSPNLRETFLRLIAENDALIRSPELGNGRQIAAARTALYTNPVREWAATQQQQHRYERRFAVVALGGTGRGEMTPCSDNDFAFLFDEALEGNQFLIELQRQVLHSSEFEDQHGFACAALPFNLDDIPNLDGKPLNSFLDMRPVFDPHGLASVFRERIRATYDPFQHFLHVRSFWKDQWERAAGESERLDRFDIKNDALRVFLAGIWTLGGKRFVHSHDLYQTLADPRDLEAYYFLLRIRAFIHLRKPKRRRPAPGGNHPEDVLEFADFTSFGELLGPEADERARFEFDTEVRARLLAARRRVARFAKGTIERELELGREATPASPIVFGVGGLRHSTSQHCSSPADKSQAALSLLLASQRYGVPIAPTELQGTFHNAGDWLVRGPELGQIFYEERGGLAETFTFLAQLEGAEERLFPGYARFESSLDNRVLTERKWLRGPLEREKQRILERHVQEGRQRLAKSVSIAQFGDPIHGVAVAVEAALLDSEHLAAVKLALKTKRLPLTADDVAVRGDETRPLHERFSTGLSEIPLAEYYVPFWVHGGFTPETIRITEFLVANRRAFKERSQAGPIDGQQVAEFRRLCPSENLLRALFVFTSADRAELWESAEADPARWFNTRELYLKTLLQFRRAGDPAHALQGAGYSADQLAILRDFGVDFFGGVYRRYANRFGAHLVRLVEEPAASSPKAGLLHDGTATIVGVAARDYRGLAATISGALWHQGVSLRQAHLFSATQHGLALDFFHLAPGIATPKPDLTKVIEDAIERQLYIGELDEAVLPRVTGTVSLEEWRPGQYCLRSEMSDDVSGLIYALAYKVFRHLRGAIFGLTAHAAKGKSFASIYLNLPPDLSLEAARSIVAIHFR